MQPVYMMAASNGSPTQAALPRVENVSCVLPATDNHGGLYIGNYFGAVNTDVLKEYGIRAVLTTSIETRSRLVKLSRCLRRRGNSLPQKSRRSR